MANKCNIRLNGRKQISLYYGNSTPFVLEGKVIMPPYVILTKGVKETANYLGISLNGVKYCIDNIFSCKQFFDRTKCGSIADTNNKKLGDFLTKCNNVITRYPNKFMSAKEIALFVLNGCKEESLNPSITFADFLNIVINDQKGKEENPESANFQVYITLRNSLKDWGKFNSKISDLHQSDFNDLSTYLKNRKGKNGKKGANWERMMQCYRAVINAAISTRYNMVTGCTTDNFITFDKKNPQTQFKQRSNKTVVELYNEKNKKGAMTFEQVEAFKKIDPNALIINMPTRHNGKGYTYTLNNNIVCLCYDICLLMLSTNGMRTKDVIRIKKDSFDTQNNQIVYLPNKLNRFGNDDRDIQNHSTPVRFNSDIKMIFEKYRNSTNTDFLFPCNCNIIQNGEWSQSRYNDTKDCMNAVLAEIGKILKLDFKPTTYTLRKTAITCNADMIYRELKERAIEEASKMAGTSKRYGINNYYKSVNGEN